MKITRNITFLQLLPLFHLLQKQKYLKSLARSKLFDSTYLWRDIVGFYSFTSNLKLLKKNLEICYCRTSFAPLFLNWKMEAPCQFLMKITWNVAFLLLLYCFICSNNKNIWNIWQKGRSFIHLILGKILVDPPASFQI